MDIGIASSTAEKRPITDPVWRDEVHTFSKTMTVRTALGDFHRKVKTAVQGERMYISLNSFKGNCCGGSTEEIAKAYIDLYTLVTGPKMLSNITLKAKNYTLGQLNFTCEAFQVVEPEVRIGDIDLSGLRPYIECGEGNIGISVSFVTSGFATRGETSTAWGGTASRSTEVLQFRADYEEIQGGHLLLNIFCNNDQTWDENSMVARATIPAAETM